MNDRLYFISHAIRRYSETVERVETQLLLARMFTPQAVDKVRLQTDIRKLNRYYLLFAKLNGFSYAALGAVLGITRSAAYERVVKGARLLAGNLFNNNREKREQLFALLGNEKMLSTTPPVEQFYADWKRHVAYQEAYYAIWPLYAAPSNVEEFNYLLPSKEEALAHFEKLYEERKRYIEEKLTTSERDLAFEQYIARTRTLFVFLARSTGVTYQALGECFGFTGQRARQLDGKAYRIFGFPRYQDPTGVERPLNECNSKTKLVPPYSAEKIQTEVAVLKRYIANL